MTAGYAVAIYPFAYFRHDDWLILGNSLRLDLDPSFAWSTNLDFGKREGTWFFRPGFKLLTHAFRYGFGLNYAVWLTALLAMSVAALLFAASTVSHLTDDAKRGTLFVALFAASVPLHIGSLAWVGEGLMNCPQVAILAFATWAFCRAALDGKPLWNAVATAAFAFALLFKESSIFHSAWLACLVVSEPKLTRFPLKTRILWLVPVTIVSASYLVFRLGWLPINPAYVPTQDPIDWLAPAGALIGCLLVPLLALGFTNRPPRAAVVRHLPYVGFAALTLLPYLGHPFFSPGWLLYPGFFSLMALCTFPWPGAHSAKVRAAGITFLVGITIVAGQMYRIGWWQWAGAQKQFTQSLKMLPVSTRRFVIRRCMSEEYPYSSLERVVGTSEALTFQAQLVTGRRIDVIAVPCSTYLQFAGTPWHRRAAVIRFRFPEFNWERLPVQ